MFKKVKDILFNKLDEILAKIADVYWQIITNRNALEVLGSVITDIDKKIKNIDCKVNDIGIRINYSVEEFKPSIHDTTLGEFGRNISPFLYRNICIVNIESNKPIIEGELKGFGTVTNTSFSDNGEGYKTSVKNYVVVDTGDQHATPQVITITPEIRIISNIM